MFKGLLTLMLTLSIFAVNAQAASHTGLKAAFEELNYSLTVEWDQRDQAFIKAQTEKFEATVRELKTQGLTDADLLDFAKSELKDARAAKDLEAALKVVQVNKMSQEEASKYLHETLLKSYSAGANWTGMNTVGLCFALTLVYAAVFVFYPGFHDGEAIWE